MKGQIILTIVLIFMAFCGYTQNNFTLSGYAYDINSGESLIGANIVLSSNPQIGTSTNTYGFFSLSIPEGKQEILVSYLGYETQTHELLFNKNIKMDFKLGEGVVFEEITISAEKEEEDKNIQSTQMGAIDLPVQKIKKLPALFGEVDILKAIQLLPGVLSSGEGSAGFYVRGGGPDQNLVLLDEAVVYNTGHLLGFFSVFNADAIKNTTLIKGGLPAQYGGRLSSVLDIQMNDGNDKSYQVEGGIGLVSSRLTVQGPIVKNKSSFILSGRRTYILDLAQFAIDNTDFAGTNYYFYDLNAKVNYRVSDKDRLYLSAYFGRDIFKFNQEKRDFYFNLPYGNATATFRWNHLFSDKLFMNFSAIYNDYDLSFDGGQEDFTFNLFSGVRDYNMKLDFDYFPNNAHHLKYGVNSTYHKLTPNIASASNGEIEFDSELLPKYGLETAVYAQDDWKINPKLSVNLGIRAAMFSQLGPYTSKLDGEEYDKFDVVKSYYGLEPRFSLKYAVNPELSLKSGITMTNQFLHLASNSASTLPTDIWVPSTEIVEPQQAIQYATGIFKNFKNNAYETSIEVYYKNLENQIDYADDDVQAFGTDEEDAFVYGKGRAYGAEFFLKKSSGRLTGWIGYTLSRSERSFQDIEDGRWYPTIYDRRHDLSIVGNYQLSDKLEIGTAFIYGTGRYYTPFESFYFIENTVIPNYGPRNSAQLIPYHRLDLSLTWKPKPRSNKAYQSYWTFSVYNTYNRKNPFFIYFDAENNATEGQTSISAKQVTIFPIIPSITYNFKWKQKTNHE